MPRRLHVLDEWAIRDHIKADDAAAIAEMISGVTIVQCNDYLKYATECGSQNCVASILDYKNAHFSEYDPMDEFVLKW